MKMVLYILLGFAIILLFFLSFKLNYSFINLQNLSLGQVCYKEKCFSVELAKTKQQRDYGLMNRKELSKDFGMLFIFDKEGIYPFWMKNTLIPLDIIWISENSEVVYIAQNVQSCRNLICPSVVPIAKAKYVLEINAGVCREIDLKVGDKLKIRQ
jgi:uncharacterized membrane protein (UPF0127 family)